MSTNYYYTLAQGNAVKVKQYIANGMQHQFAWHSTIELMIVLTGELQVYADGKLYILHENDVLMLGSNCGHAILDASANCILIVTEVNQNLLEEREIPICQHSVLCSADAAPKTAEVFNRIRYHVATMLRHFKARDWLSNTAVDASAALLFTDIYREFEADIGTPPSPTVLKKRNEVIRRITEFIDTNFGQTITLKEIAEVAGYNRTYLSTLFKQQMGISISEYILRVRIQKAVSLLKLQKKNLTDIAMTCGFPDNRIFTSRIKQYCGKTPQEYRRSLAEEKDKEDIGRHYVEAPNSIVEEKMLQYQKQDSLVSLNTSLEKITNHCRQALQILAELQQTV